ncbi:MAG: hypothetical protein MJ252_16330 [archaeon]|nr:hypothetical protein [archaeon]
MSSLYYIGVGVFSLASSIYNFEMFSEAKNVTCYKCTEMNETEYNNYITRIETLVTINCTLQQPPPNYYDILVEKTNIYKILALCVAIASLLMVVLAIYLSCVTNSLSNQLPDDFLKMGKCKQFFACFCKIFPAVILVLSWINFILILVHWILYEIKYCEEAIDRSPAASMDYTEYRKKNLPLLIVNSVIWACLHLGGSIVREMTYIEPFMYAPDTGSPNCCRTFILKKFGP